MARVWRARGTAARAGHRTLTGRSPVRLARLGLRAYLLVGVVALAGVTVPRPPILSNPKQLAASLALTVWLMATEHIELRNVIGHNESLTSPYHRELVAAWRCQTHGDWTHADMEVYRAKLAALARRYSVPLGPPA